jgi:hypothetical protein
LQSASFYYKEADRFIENPIQTAGSLKLQFNRFSRDNKLHPVRIVPPGLKLKRRSFDERVPEGE